jgi:arylsulfatase A-like enzyme
MILIDDSGFGQWGTFGGQTPTPNLDRLARSGISYLRFHTTALCSPSSDPHSLKTKAKCAG